MPTQIVYAYSEDGINWIKPDELNPVLTTGPEVWDSSNIISPFVIKENDVLKMWYAGIGGSPWQIGYATASADWLPTITPSQTPSSSPTPSPTPSPTHGPTPTPPIKKVILIPGMTASWNLDAMINCKASNYSGSWTLLGPARDVYNPLIQALSHDGWQVSVLPYDWRAQVSSHTTEIQNMITSLTSPNEKVDIVGHSMGGLLARAYLEKTQSHSKVEKLMTVGSPHQGTALVYPVWSAGEIGHGDPTYRFMLTLLEKRCAVITRNDRLAIQQYFQSVQNMLPIVNYLYDNVTGAVKPVASMLEKNNWLPTLFASPFYGISVGTLSGTGQTTTLGYRVILPTFGDLSAGNWLDGKPVSTITTTEGDGTVLTSSTEIEGATNTTIPGTHTSIVSSQAGITQIQQFLTAGGALAAANTLTIQNKPTKIEPPVVSSSLYVIADPANFWLIDHKGKIVKATDGIIALSNPSAESYTLVIFPKSNSTLVIISQDFGEKFFYKEYTLKNMFPKIKFIHFDTKHPKEDILH